MRFWPGNLWFEHLMYLTKLVQHVLSGDAHILQHQVAIINVLKIHFRTNVSCNYTCSTRKHSLFTPAWPLFSPFCIGLGISREGHIQLCFPSMDDVARGMQQCLEMFTWAQWMVLKAADLHNEGMHTIALPMDVELGKGHGVGCWPSHCEKRNSHVPLGLGTVQMLHSS